jgi:hypothetical protein
VTQAVPFMVRATRGKTVGQGSCRMGAGGGGCGGHLKGRAGRDEAVVSLPLV